MLDKKIVPSRKRAAQSEIGGWALPVELDKFVECIGARSFAEYFLALACHGVSFESLSANAANAKRFVVALNSWTYRT
jgi:hypothetical protein